MKNLKKILWICLFIVHKQLLSYMPNQVQAVKKILQTPGRILNCSGCDLRGLQDLAGLNLQGAFMPGVAMQPCLQSDTNKNSMMICIEKQVTDLTGTNLSHANISGSCLDGVILHKADLTETDISNSSVQFANLQGAVLKDCITTNTTFCHSIMPDGLECKDVWKGQDMIIDCNCFDTISPQASTSVHKEEAIEDSTISASKK